jgi:UDP-GlcNAc3NAcA epimerase
LAAFLELKELIDFSIHPRTRQKLTESGLDNPQSNIQLIDPIGYLDMVMLGKNALVIVTDSGAVQKDAYFHRVPCVTLRPETEWVETVKTGWNQVVGQDKEKIIKAIRNASLGIEIDEYGNEKAAHKIVQIMKTLGL